MPAFSQDLTFVFLCFFSIIPFSYASEHGLTGFSGNPATNGGAACSVCHVPPTTTKPMVIITGSTLVYAGQPYEYTVTVKGGSGIAAGVDITSSGSTSIRCSEILTCEPALRPVDGDLRYTGEGSFTSPQKVSRELTHLLPKPKVSNQASFKFYWTAPKFNQTVTLFAAGVSTNGLHNLLGDGTGSASLFVRVVNGTTPEFPPPAPKPTILISFEEYVKGLDTPVAISHAKDSRVFIVEKAGKIKVAAGRNNLLADPFLDISINSGRTDLATEGEQGLLGLAFHPNYARNGFFYVYYSRKIDLPDNTVQLRSRISRFTRSSDNSNKADEDSEVVFMEFKQLDGITKAFHKAGDLHFGPDGYLYIASGDGAGDAQSFGNLGGKLLRIDVDHVPDLTNAPDCDVSGKRNYRIPSGNAFTNGKGNGCDEIYVLGLRNPWRFSFDRTNGNIWVSDVGSHNNNITGYIASEEINFIAAGTRGGINLGWPCYEGNKIGFPEKTATGCKRDYLFPVYSYNHQDPDIYTSIIGGYVYRGKDSPDLIGKYLFANLTSSFDSTIQILSGPLTRPNVVELSLAGKVDLPTTFGEDFRGELYIAGNGGIYKVGGTNLP